MMGCSVLECVVIIIYLCTDVKHASMHPWHMNSCILFLMYPYGQMHTCACARVLSPLAQVLTSLCDYFREYTVHLEANKLFSM